MRRCSPPSYTQPRPCTQTHSIIIRSLNVGLQHPERHGGPVHGNLFAQTLIYQPTGRRPSRPNANFVVGNARPVRERHLFR
jgi:hypothetical protein